MNVIFIVCNFALISGFTYEVPFERLQFSVLIQLLLLAFFLSQFLRYFFFLISLVQLLCYRNCSMVNYTLAKIHCVVYKYFCFAQPTNGEFHFKINTSLQITFECFTIRTHLRASLLHLFHLHLVVFARTRLYQLNTKMVPYFQAKRAKKK